MAAKTPIRAVYTGANATGLAEYQSGEFIDYTQDFGMVLPIKFSLQTPH